MVFAIEGSSGQTIQQGGGILAESCEAQIVDNTCLTESDTTKICEHNIRQLPGCLVALGVPRHLTHYRANDCKGGIYVRYDYDELLALTKRYFRSSLKKYPPHDAQYQSQTRELIQTYKRACYLIQNHYEPGEIQHKKMLVMKKKQNTIDKRRTLGLCPRCGHKPSKDRIYCDRCLEKNRKYQKQNYKKKDKVMIRLIKRIKTCEHAKGLNDFLHYQRKQLIGQLLDVEHKIRELENDKRFDIKTEWYPFQPAQYED